MGIFRTTFQSLLNEYFHSFCRLLTHSLRHMTVHVQRKTRGCVSQISLNRFDIVSTLQGGNCITVPLRYNYDKPEKPRISRVFGYQARFFILFQPEKSSREVVIS